VRGCTAAEGGDGAGAVTVTGGAIVIGIGTGTGAVDARWGAQAVSARAPTVSADVTQKRPAIMMFFSRTV